MVVETTPLAQAREVDDLIARLRELRDREARIESELKDAQEEVKELKASLEKVRSAKNTLIDELSGKKTYPLFDEIKKLDAEQDKLETPVQPTTETPQQVTLERIGETNNIVKLTLGEQSVEISLEEMEKRLIGEDPDEYPTYDSICDAGWAGMQELSQEELLDLFNELSPKEEAEVSQDASNIVSFLKPETEQLEESPDPLLETNLLNEPPVNLAKKVFEVELTSDERIVVAQGSKSLTFPASKTDKILAYYRVKSVGKLTQDNLSEIFYEQVDYSKPKEENLIADNEEWPESIHALPKPDGSLILKCGTRMRKVNAADVPTNLDTTSQDQLNALWLSNIAYNHNPEHDKIEIPSLSGKKQAKKKKLAEATI